MTLRREAEVKVTEHIALLGDSIFDNASYTGGAPDVITHLRQVLPPGFRASLFALDGSTTSDLEEQLDQIPRDVGRVVVSIGGNDALVNADLLDLPVTSTREALLLFGQRITRFESSYREAIASVLRRVPSTTVCTVYNGNLPEDQARSARIALTMFNDAILRVAFEWRLPVIDLRLVCRDPSDYANPIEPSGSGGAKIARAIANTLTPTPDHSSPSKVFTS
jgi:hypothetical protein